MRIVEAVARLPRTHPTVLDSSHPYPIEGSPALRGGSRSQNTRMISHDEREHDRWYSQPPTRERVPPNRFPGHPHCCQCQRKAKVSNPNVKFLVVSNQRFTVFETLPIFFDGQHSLRIHQAVRIGASVR